ncbi:MULTISPECIES: acyl carrier protein [unclassified Mesorhizobium]|uniref:acyl carrier protein n=1 Tax=unclassified Mesorhizobium TaxID=325217 RepID=UPI0006FD6E75|nr:MULTISPECIES: acyl carrier protein [unclassified Mesorhizobium]KQZ15357.1 hypothetical protein ASD27_15785 [Mesorhizobium sp. Root1471]KQZ37865.1 hypothetical protein ASD44_15780 [Mesorhizobium sp. Root554]MDR7033474.1 acyl carrier protein [Mesorhizobium sp. BE184]
MLENNDQTASVEVYLRELWTKLLGLDTVGPDDDFFALGGSSMQVVEMLVAVSEHYNEQIEFVEFFKNPTVSNLSQLLKS